MGDKDHSPAARTTLADSLSRAMSSRCLAGHLASDLLIPRTDRFSHLINSRPGFDPAPRSNTQSGHVVMPRNHERCQHVDWLQAKLAAWRTRVPRYHHSSTFVLSLYTP